MRRELVRIEDIASDATLWEGWVNASQGDGKEERRDVVKYAENLTENLKSLQKRLLSGTWVPDNGETFMLFTEGKWREIHTVGVEDRIVHYALIKNFHLSSHFVNRTFGSIKGRGTLKATKQVRKDIHRSGYTFCVKGDIFHYYPSALKAVFISLIRRHYKGEAAIKLFEMVIMAYKPELERGISIGSLTSQDGGNFYLTPMDYLLLYVLGVKYYARYVDDIVVLVKDKKEARRIIETINSFAEKYGLRFGKIALFPINARRIDFCSYAINAESNRVRKSTRSRLFRQLRKLTKHPRPGEYERNSIYSRLGIFKHADSFNFLNNVKNEYNQVFRRIERYATGKRKQKSNHASTDTGTLGVSDFLRTPGRGTRRGRNRRGNKGTICKDQNCARC